MQQKGSQGLWDIHKLEWEGCQIGILLNLLNFGIHRRQDPFWATRVGEAKNPGPEPFKFAIVNPTAVLGKISDICSLQTHAVMLSENSATKSVQVESSHIWRSKGFKTIWSTPVAAHSWTFKEDEARRGQASGVSIHSRLPIRNSRIPISDKIDHTRIVSAIIQCGKWPIHVVTIYGYPLCQKESKNKTDQLLLEAAAQVEQTGLPSLIVGDFNVPCHDLSATQMLFQEGHLTLEQIYCQIYGKDMPLTCREPTRPDQAIIHPKLIPFVSHIEVNKTKVVPDHDPVIFHLSIPLEQPMTQNWNLPSSWLQYEPDAELVELAFLQQWKPPTIANNESSLSDALKLWATTCEHAVDWAIRKQHHDNPEKYPQKCLPAKAKGRNQSRSIVKKPITCVSKACEGQYNPQIETASFRLNHWIRQLRRLQSLQNRIRKLQHLETIWTDTHQQLQQEWIAIQNAKGFQRGFPEWCANIPEIGYFPLTYPDESFLLTAIQFLRHQCDCQVAKEKSVRKKVFKFVQQHDAKHRGLQKAAKEIRGAINPNLAQTTRSLSVPFQLLHSSGGFATLAFCETPNFHFQGHASCDDIEVQFVDIRANEADVMIIDADQELPIQGTLVQSTVTMEASKIAEDLTQYWNSFWQRDTIEETTDDSHWTQFLTAMNEVPNLPPVTLDIDQIDVWLEVIKSSKSNSARGVDGWYMDEIKNLPSRVIQELAKIFAQHEGQHFGEQDMQVITIPMCKTDNPTKPSQTRPITLLGMLYRLWSKVSSKILLRQLQQTLPESIIGFIPGRSMQLAMLQQQFDFEKLHQIPGTPIHWEGVTLDIVKCFNAIARLPASYAMAKIGIPTTWIRFWLDSLGRAKRFWKIHDQLWEGDTSTTGCPEGDCWSILACLGVSYIWVQLVTQGTNKPLAFADNWNWRSQDTESNIIAIRRTIHYLTSIRLDIDWTKTWIWCTRSVIKMLWKNRVSEALPAADIRVVTSARELGYTMHYNRVQNRYSQKERTKEAMRRWTKLQKVPLSLDDKGKIAHWALIKAFFATECYAVGQSWLQKSRTAIGKCLIPNRKNTNPYLATMLLTKHTKDPELFVIIESVRAIRHLLWNSSQNFRQEFFDHVARHTRKHSDVYGPAGALSFNLARIGWSLNSQGFLLTDTLVTFHLMKDSIPTIEKFLEQTWMRHVMQTCILRPAWRNFPPIDRKKTLQIFSKIPEFQKRIGSYHLTGSCMMNDQKKHFTDLTENCQLCGKPDSETHRLLECFETSAVRQKHPEIVAYLQEHDVCNHHLPVVWAQPHWEFDWLYYQNIPDIQIDQELLQSMHSQCTSELPLLVFTDGSCTQIGITGKKVAAAAIVCHINCNTTEQLKIVNQYLETNTIPSTYQVLGVGECQGEQVIPRAELQAVVTIANCHIRCEIHTDSQYVLDIAEKIRQYPDVKAFHKAKNFDLLSSFWHQLRTGHITLRKVKAHAFTKEDSVTTSFLKLGNMAADAAAKVARLQYEQRHLERQHDDDLDKVQQQHFQLLYDLHCARDKWFAMNEEKLTLPTGHRNSLQWMGELQHYTVTSPREPIIFPTEVTEILDTCLWGTEYSLQIFQWLQLLQFPEQQDDNDPGISWYELAVSFLMTAQTGIVVNNAEPGQPFQPRKLDKNDTDVSFGLQVYSFERCVTQVTRTLQIPLLPKRRKYCTSVKMLGLRHAKAGLQTRPTLPHQTQLVKLLYEHFAAIGGDETFQGGPLIPTFPSMIPPQKTGMDATDRQDAWISRHRRYQARKARYQARKSTRR